MAKASLRNPVFVALVKRHGQTTKVMRDRRQIRGGARNKVRDYLTGKY